MNRRSSFYRKVGYGIAIAVLMLPLAWLGIPKTRDPGDNGGVLAQMRTKYHLGQAELGEIDPASEALRLATLGMRGIATNLLWSKATHYKMVEDWTAFSETLNQLSRMQPYFISVWKHQAWNLTYNVSVEVDDVEDRFYYVMKGIEYLKKGTVYNRDNPNLLEHLGWFLGNKIGRADEKTFYRKLFKADKDFHKDRPLAQRDNWLVAQTWYNKAVAAVDVRKQSLGQKNPPVFYEKPARTQFSYATAIEDEGTFGTRASRAWAKALEMWQAFGNRELKMPRGYMVRLADLDRWEKEVERLQEELDALSPGLHAQLLTDAFGSITPEEKAAMNVGLEQRSPAESKLADTARDRLSIGYLDIADAIARKFPDKASEARRIAQRVADAKQRVHSIKSNHNVVQYPYWEAKANLEQSPEVLKARELAYEAKIAYKKRADQVTAKAQYEESFQLWAKALSKHPEIDADTPTASDIMVYIEEYQDLLDQRSMSLADPELADAFPLWDILLANDGEGRFRKEIDKYQDRRLKMEDIPEEQRPLLNLGDMY